MNKAKSKKAAAKTTGKSARVPLILGGVGAAATVITLLLRKRSAPASI